jgi:hypothetical protein
MNEEQPGLELLPFKVAMTDDGIKTQHFIKNIYYLVQGT